MDSFTVYKGKFPCKTCKKDVMSMRVYVDTGIATWMCQEKHLSKVELFNVGYKKKKDYIKDMSK